jgi:hypothetical protein
MPGDPSAKGLRPSLKNVCAVAFGPTLSSRSKACFVVLRKSSF